MVDKDALLSLREKKDKFDRLGQLSQKLSARLETQRREQQELERLVSEREKSLHKLEGGITAALYSLFGRKEDKLRAAQERLSEAQRSSRNAAARVRELTAEYGNIQREMAALGSAKEAYDRAFSEKAAYLRNNDPIIGGRLRDIEAQLQQASLLMPEIRQALEVGVRVLEKIASIEDDLDVASNLGMWDMMGGGAVSGLAKHSQLDDAQTKANELVPLLNSYRSELADVNIDTEIQVGISGIMKFADFFLDGLFADWSVLEKIHDSQKRIADVRSQVELVQTRLDSTERSNSAKLSELRRQLEEIIINA